MRHHLLVTVFSLLFWNAQAKATNTTVTTIEKAKYYSMEGKKLISQGEIEQGTKLKFLKSVAKGKWIQVSYNNKDVYLSSKKLAGVPPPRTPAATTEATLYRYNTIGIGTSLGYSTSLSAPAAGIAVFYNPKDWLNPALHQLSVGGYFHYYLLPGDVTGASQQSAMTFAATARYQYHLLKNFHVGAEGGLSLVMSSSTVTIVGLGTYSASVTELQPIFGAFARYRLGESWQITAGLRLLGIPNFLGGLEYQF